MGTSTPPADQERLVRPARPKHGQHRAVSGDVSEARVGGGKEADSVTSAEQSSNRRPEICLEGKATLFLEFLALGGTFSKRVNKRTRH